MRGAAALAATMVMLLLAAMLAAQTTRQIWFDAKEIQRREFSLQAAAAADAGAAWVLAMLNANVWPQTCEPDTQGSRGAKLYRDLVLQFDAAGRIQLPSSAAGVQGVCRMRDSAWTCQCRPPVLPKPEGIEGGPPSPSFQVRLQGLSRPGTVRVTVSACSHAPGICNSPHNDAAQASVEQDLALYSALRNPPRAALLSVGIVHLDNAANAMAALPAITNTAEPQAPLIVQTGADIVGNTSGLHAGSGTNSAPMIRSFQPHLQYKLRDTLFLQQFGVPRAAYMHQAAMRHIDCNSGQDCSNALNQAQLGGARLLGIPGPAQIDGALNLGDALHPVVLFVDGDLRIDGPAHLHGLLIVGGDLDWQALAGQTSRIEGAVICLGQTHLRGPVWLDHAPALLERLRLQQGSFVPLPGSWTSS